MTLALLHSKTFDVGDLPVLTFGNCKLKTGVTKWALKLYVRFLPFLTFFSKSKNMTLFGVVAHVFSKAGERCPWGEISTFLGATPSREQTMREQHVVSGRSLRAWTMYCRSVFVTGPRLNEHSVHASMTRQQSASDCETIRIPP